MRTTRIMSSEENNTKIPERLSGVALEQANKAVAPHSMGD